MRVVTRNLNNRKDAAGIGRALLDLSPDIVLLSETDATLEAPPGQASAFERGTTAEGAPQRFSAGMTVKRETGEALGFEARQDWVTAALTTGPPPPMR